MLELFSELHESGLSQEEFEFTRSYLSGSAAFERATANQRLFRTIQEEIYALPKGYADGFSERLVDMSTADINAAIAEHTKPESLCVVIVATAEKTLPALEALPWDSIEVLPFDAY